MTNKRLISKISLINRVVLDSMNAVDESIIVKNFIQAAIQMLRADFGFSFIKNHKTGKFTLLYKDKRTPYVPMPPRKTGITAKALKKRQPLYFTVAGQAGKVRNDAKQFMKGVVVIPVSYKKTNFGTLDICFYSKHNFTQEEKVLCAYIGTSAAQAIALKQSYGELEELVAIRTSQLKDINQRLEQDKASDDAILASIGEGLMATDKEGVIIFANPHAQSMFGWKDLDLIGQSIFTLLPLKDEKDEDVPKEKRPTFLALTKGVRIIKNNYSYLTKNKQVIPCHITASPVKLDGEIIGTIQVFRDISQEKEIDRVKTELISLASHQLRTPLSAINWYTEVLMKQELGKLNSDQKRYLEQIYHANQKMVEMVYDFLNVSRLELGTFTAKLANIDIPELAHGVIREIMPLITQKQLKVKEEYGRELHAVEIDKKVIRLILQNLLTNAVKYTPNKGRVNLSINFDSQKSLLVIVVSDNGHGIPKAQHNKVFTKLFRADNAAKLDTGGSGLGLYLVKSFVDFCQGKISFTSQENKGTTFIVKLPVRLL